MSATAATERRRPGRMDARAERARPSHLTALAHGMSLTIAHGDTTARTLPDDWSTRPITVGYLAPEDRPGYRRDMTETMAID